MRLYIQLLSAAFSNSFLKGFKLGSVYSGGTKAYCIPALNCGSCPGALFSCPIGILQQQIANKGSLFYIIGFIAFVGALLGRLVCGFLCPFGLLQDLIYKIPFVKKLKTIKGDKVLRHLKGVIFFLFCLILPLFVLDEFGYGKAWFCSYICPAGTLEAGIPLCLLNDGLRASIGFLFAWKATILVFLIILSLLIYRPFCRYLCPFGYILGKFNKVSLYQMKVDSKKCIDCGKCEAVCKMAVDIRIDANSSECIRCGECKNACPVKAISSELRPLSRS